MLGLHFTPVCVLLSVCSLHFTLSLHFTPGRQSAVCSPQSSFYTDRLFLFFAHMLTAIILLRVALLEIKVGQIKHVFGVLESYITKMINYKAFLRATRGRAEWQSISIGSSLEGRGSRVLNFFCFVLFCFSSLN